MLLSEPCQEKNHLLEWLAKACRVSLDRTHHSTDAHFSTSVKSGQKSYKWEPRQYISHTVFSQIVSAETILFLNWPYLLWPLATAHISVETIQGRKLFRGGKYLRKYSVQFQIWLQKVFRPIEQDVISMKTNCILKWHCYYRLNSSVII